LPNRHNSAARKPWAAYGQPRTGPTTTLADTPHI
jgi:hypothetical protein